LHLWRTCDESIEDAADSPKFCFGEDIRGISVEEKSRLLFPGVCTSIHCTKIYFSRVYRCANQLPAVC
jgi:hypothetical protein